MKISDEQIRRSVEYLRAAPKDVQPSSRHRSPAVSDELLARVRVVLESVPDVRPDRVEEARALVADSLPDAETVAEKLIGRVLSDAVR